MNARTIIAMAALAAAMVTGAATAQAPAREQYIPVVSFRTGPYAPNGTPLANGIVDYYKLVNARGGINGVKILFEECDTGYDAARTVECYERTKSKNGGAAVIQPWSTGATFAITEKAHIDKVPIVTVGLGRADSADGTVFKWNFPLMGNYWVAADVIVQAIAKREGGFDKLAGKTIAIAYHDSPFGKESLALLQERARMHNFKLLQLPITPPGLEQRSVWLQVRQNRPDYVVLWGWGTMNLAAIKEAQATAFPRDRMYGVWWAGAEPDVKDAGEAAKGYNSVILQNSAHYDAKVVKDILATLHDKTQGTGPREEVGQVLYLRGVISAMLTLEGIRAAQERYGKGKVMTGEQVRWGLENLNLTQAKLDALGFAGVMRPISTSCADHMGSYWARMHQWDGKNWKITSDWMQGDEQIIKPMIRSAAAAYAAEKKITPRSGSDCQS